MTAPWEIDEGVRAERRAWARRYVAAGPDAPVFGTPDWVALPDGPAKIAAVVRAAEAWVTDGENWPENVALELDPTGERARAAKRAEDEQWHAQREAHEQHWPSRTAELRRRLRLAAGTAGGDAA